MSRTVKLKLPEEDLIQMCRMAGIAIYSSEGLPCGGTRLYCKTEQGAAEVRQQLRAHVLLDEDVLVDEEA